MRNESNSLYISTSYYDRINFDTCPWWTSISVCILMLCTRGRVCGSVALRVCVTCAPAKHNLGHPTPGKSYNRNHCAPMKLLCPLSYAYVRVWMRERVASSVNTFASCGLQFGWKGKAGKSLHQSRYRRSVCVIKVSLSESVSRLNKVFRWTEFRVTLEENDMRASRLGAESRLHSLRATLDIESRKWAISHSGELEDF